MISDINDDKKEINETEGTILNLFYESQIEEKIKKVDFLLKNENIETVKQIINNDSIFLNLNNNQLLVLIQIIINDKNNSQPYLKKIIDYGDHELIFSIAKNKSIYYHLNRENKHMVNSKLNKNPWINHSDITSL